MKSQTNSKIRKPVAAVILVVLVLFLAWASVQLVRVMPSAFSSLASLAEGIRQESEVVIEDPVTLTVTSDTKTVSNDEVVELAWNTTKQSGTYTFSFPCVSGVGLSIDDGHTGYKNIDCDTTYNLGKVDTLRLKVESEKHRYQDVAYTVSFLKTSEETPVASGTASFTIVNSEIDEALATEETPDEQIAGESTSNEDGTPVSYEQEFVYAIPTSDPNGRTDLAIKYLNSGIIVGNTFFSEAIKQGEKGAIQFEVKNYGTKTSDEWTFSIDLPSGFTYESSDQKPLKPNERAVLTVGFVADEDSSHTFRGQVQSSADRNTNNDQFRQPIVFLR